MKTYILIHGAWGYGGEFDDVVRLLSSDGSRVIAPDLPGHGKSNETLTEVTMGAYVQRAIDTINSVDGSVVLVGHSLAGAIISQVAEIIPEKIERLIYVAAMLPKTGDTPLALMQSDKEGELLPRIIFSEDQTYATLTEEDIRNILLHDVVDEERLDRSIPMFLMKQATQPFMTPARLTKENFGKAAKYYIRANLDKVLSLSLQDEMISNWRVEEVLTLDSGHFPLTSIPGRLVETIRKLS